MNSQEPRNGDFVAYIEQLQRESAARLRAAGASQIVELPNKPVATTTPTTGMDTPVRSPTPVRTSSTEVARPVLTRQQAETLGDQLTSAQRNAPREGRASAGPAIALVVGGLMIVHALTSNGGFLPLAIGIGLAVWGFRRLRTLSSGSTADRLRRHAEYKQRVAQTFGKPPSS